MTTSTYKVANGTIKNVHSPTVCAGENCCIHNPSSHSMLSFPQHFGRRGNIFMERECTHGLFHPDPDDPKTKNWVERRHHCDGCCKGCYVGYPGKPYWWNDDLHTPDQRLLINRAQCLKCADIIESLSVHDFVSCVCGAIFVDGGREYQRYGADEWAHFIDMSVYEEINNDN
jgi:hypothetical protein